MSSPPAPGIYKLQSAARPTQYANCMEGTIVGYSSDEGPPDQWAFKLHEGLLATFEAIRDGIPSGLYISFQKALVRQACMLRFSIKVNGLVDRDVWALLSWDNGTPVNIQPDTGSTQELWVFEPVNSA
ncbi:hypothetical protein K503DRAFT_856626 [Rhizopogon vinicolor AM-OR11-026]|uniref:Uncharacterized protein n=1 Tax=Rhizopogon vinicolor AM-OR11-026 TaxID=1314800 RepID=A0A1B7N141_9AGAM|nr:hypothetical protein K503DRAFT_856626 [Rhizopogon vinicolor AM-OR11-026]